MRRDVIITVIISLAFLALGAVFWQSYLRFGEACRDFGLSVAYYFCELFGVEYAFTPTVTEYSSVMQWDILLPSDFAGFTDAAGRYFSLLISGENFAGYWSAVGRVMGITAKVLIIALPCVLLLIIIVRAMYRRSNTKHNHDTLPLRIFKWLAKWMYQPIKRVIKSYLAFLKRHLWIVICWALLWVFHLNLASIAMAFFAYYFYFVLSFDIGNLYVQVCKLLIDLQVIFRHFPWWSVATVAWLLFNRWRKKDRLEPFAALRGKELRIHQRAAHRVHVVRQHGEEKDDAHHGHGALAGGHVPAESIADFANQRHEAAAFPVDHVRGRAARVHGARHRVQFSVGQDMGGTKTVTVPPSPERNVAALWLRYPQIRRRVQRCVADTVPL